MKICPNCQKENDNHANYCNFCGYTLGQPQSGTEADGELHQRNLNGVPLKKSWLKWVISGGAIIIVLLLLRFSGYSLFSMAYQAGYDSQANTIYTLYQNDSRTKRHMDDYLLQVSDEIYRQFKDRQIDGEQAKENLNRMSGYINISSAVRNIDKLEQSRNSFQLGTELFEKQDYYNAFWRFKNVITDDENYLKAQDYLEQSKAHVKKACMSELKKYRESDDVSGALTYISDMERIFEKDAQFDEEKYYFKNREKEIALQKLRNAQKVSVQSCTTVNLGYYATDRNARVLLKNNSNKTVVDCSVAILLFDDKGDAVTMEDTTYGYDNLIRCKADDIRLPAGGTWGDNYVWKIDEKATKIKACVMNVEFEDGKTWQNPYYDEWIVHEKFFYK